MVAQTPTESGTVSTTTTATAAAEPEKGLTGTGELSKKGLDNDSTGTPVRRYTFDNGYGAKVWKGDVDGEFRIAALNTEGRVVRGIPGIRRLPASLATADVNDILDQLAALT